jgi:hypothetical protein
LPHQKQKLAGRRDVNDVAAANRNPAGLAGRHIMLCDVRFGIRLATAKDTKAAKLGIEMKHRWRKDRAPSGFAHWSWSV